MMEKWIVRGCVIAATAKFGWDTWGEEGIEKHITRISS
jgi:hypothetical protein